MRERERERESMFVCVYVCMRACVCVCVCVPRQEGFPPQEKSRQEIQEEKKKDNDNQKQIQKHLSPAAERSAPAPAAPPGRVAAAQKFSEVSAIVRLLCKGTIENTFENTRYRQ